MPCYPCALVASGMACHLSALTPCAVSCGTFRQSVCGGASLLPSRAVQCTPHVLLPRVTSCHVMHQPQCCAPWGLWPVPRPGGRWPMPPAPVPRIMCGVPKCAMFLGPMTRQLVNLQMLCLDDNQLTGHCPAAVAELPQLKQFAIDRNKLEPLGQARPWHARHPHQN